MSTDLAKVALLKQLASEWGVPLSSLSADRVALSVAEYLPTVVNAASDSQVERFRAHWRRAVEDFGDRKVHEVKPSDILALRVRAIQYRDIRANARLGRYAGEGAVRAMRFFCQLAVADGLISGDANPAAVVELPRRLPNVRRALTNPEIEAINHVVVTTGRDVALDSLLFRLHLETACRRGGALNLRLADVDAESCTVRLREKFGTERWQPVSPTLAAALLTHARERGVHDPGDALLRLASGAPLSPSRYDRMWKRVRDRLPWAAKLGVSTHWLRHTTLTWVERHYGYAVARAYAGHTDTKGGSTLTYIKGIPHEVATALSAYTGEPHPLANPYATTETAPWLARTA